MTIILKSFSGSEAGSIQGTVAIIDRSATKWLGIYRAPAICSGYNLYLLSLSFARFGMEGPQTDGKHHPPPFARNPKTATDRQTGRVVMPSRRTPMSSKRDFYDLMIASKEAVCLLPHVTPAHNAKMQLLPHWPKEVISFRIDDDCFRFVDSGSLRVLRSGSHLREEGGRSTERVMWTAN
jgi:hypothetical protein